MRTPYTERRLFTMNEIGEIVVIPVPTGETIICE